VLLLGVDIGATKIAAGRVDEHARVSSPVLVPTRAGEGFEASLGQLWSAIEQVLVPEVGAIGVCAPGPLNPKTGVVLNPPNLPGWLDVPLSRLIQERYGLSCHVENDANAAGLAEALFGAARGFSSVFYATLSTGIGAGIIFDGRIYHGKNGAAAEGGHISIDYRGSRVCNCGVPGCIEAIASGTALAKAGHPPEELARGLARGEPDALRVFDELCEALAAWLGGVISLLDPDIIVLGGGLTNLGDPLFERLRVLTPQRTINRFAASTPIVPAALREHTGIVGAAVAAGRNLKAER
jgi:glucokinase